MANLEDEYDYWEDQRYEDMYFGLHGHLPGIPNRECALCVERA